MSLVISNMDTCFLPPKTAFSLSSALMLRLFSASCRLCFLMYSHTFLVTSVRGIAAAPMTAANVGEIVIGFMNAAFGLAAASFLGAAAALAATGFFAAAAGFAAVLAAGFFGAVAINSLLHKFRGRSFDHC